MPAYVCLGNPPSSTYQFSFSIRQLVTLFVHPTPRSGSMEIPIVTNSFKVENRLKLARPYATFKTNSIADNLTFRYACKLCS